ncbi:unnamed protein product, partial [Porites evermanni]
SHAILDHDDHLVHETDIGLAWDQVPQWLKGEPRFIIEKIVGRRDVFGKLPTGYGKSLTFQLLPGVLKSLNAKGYDFHSTPLVVVISPLMSIVEDQTMDIVNFFKLLALTMPAYMNT